MTTSHSRSEYRVAATLFSMLSDIPLCVGPIGIVLFQAALADKFCNCASWCEFAYSANGLQMDWVWNFYTSRRSSQFLSV